MCIFNDLSGGDKYPNLVVFYEDGRERIIKNVSYFSIWEDVTTRKNTVRIFLDGKDKPTICKDVKYVIPTYYNYKKVNGHVKLEY